MFSQKGKKKGPEPPQKRPNVRFVTKLDRATETLDKVNKKVTDMLWILGKLKDPAKYYQSLTKRPKKTVAAMLAEMPKKDGTEFLDLSSALEVN